MKQRLRDVAVSVRQWLERTVYRHWQPQQGVRRQKQYTLSEDANIALEWVDKQMWCAHTEQPIEAGSPAVVIWSPLDEAERRAISVGAVEGLRAHLATTLNGETRVNGAVAGDSRVKFGRVSDDATCPVCHENVRAQTVALSIYTPTEEIERSHGIHRPSPLRCHRSCVPALAAALDGIWEYSDELIGDVA